VVVYFSVQELLRGGAGGGAGAEAAGSQLTVLLCLLPFAALNVVFHTGRIVPGAMDNLAGTIRPDRAKPKGGRPLDPSLGPCRAFLHTDGRCACAIMAMVLLAGIAIVQGVGRFLAGKRPARRTRRTSASGDFLTLQHTEVTRGRAERAGGQSAGAALHDWSSDHPRMPACVNPARPRPILNPKGLRSRGGAVVA
jgi:hypothetical protein